MICPVKIIGTIFGPIFTPSGVPGALTHEKGKSSIFKSENFNPPQIGQFWEKLKK